MPIYEFECRGCGHHFEELVLPWLADGPQTPVCPSCKGQEVERLLSICSVSSESTRQASLQKARKKATAVQKEKEREELREIVEHHH